MPEDVPEEGSAMSVLLLIAQAAPKEGGGGLKLDVILLMIVPLIVIFWLISRPQKKREQQRKELLSRLKKGDQVVTIGGVIGEIVRLDDREVVLLVEKKKGIELRVLRAAISNMTGPKGAEAGGTEKEGGRRQ